MQCPIFIPVEYHKDEDSLDSYEINDWINDQIKAIDLFLMSNKLPSELSDIKKEEPFLKNRSVAIDKAKLDAVYETLTKLKLLSNNLDRYFNTNGTKVKQRFVRILRTMTRKKMVKALIVCDETFDALDNNYRSPYDLPSILDPDYLQKFTKNSPIQDIVDRACSFLTLAESELKIMQESPKMNEMKKVVLSTHLDRLSVLYGQISSCILPSNKKTTMSKAAQFASVSKILGQSQRIIKDVYELFSISSPKDYSSDSEPIFDVVNERVVDAFSDVDNYIRSIKKDWLEVKCENVTQSICRSTLLRKLNIRLKQIKKLTSLKDNLDPSWIVIGLKNILHYANQEIMAIDKVHKYTYYLTFKHLPKPRRDIPQNFIRNDPVFDEIKETPHNGLFIIYIHVLEYLEYCVTKDWNIFQERKPYGESHYLSSEIMSTIHLVSGCEFTENESHEISLDLADRFLMTKQKISYDAETLEFRFNIFKPLKPHKFAGIKEIYKILKKEGNKYKLQSLLSDQFDGIIDSLKRKVTNRGQLIIFQKAMAMMKRALYLLRIMRTVGDEHLEDQLMEQAVHEFIYASQIVVELLDLLRPNRRVTFSFKANGFFTKQMDFIGLKIKDDFSRKVESQIKTVKKNIKQKEADLETVKEDKTHLRYLQSILNRANLIPINELELSEKDNVEILREIIEEYEFTVILYGSVN